MWYVRRKRLLQVDDDPFDLGGRSTFTLSCATTNCGCTAQIIWNEFPLPGESPWSNFHEREGKVHSAHCHTDTETLCFEHFKDRVYQLLRASSTYTKTRQAYMVAREEYRRYRPLGMHQFPDCKHFRPQGDKIIAKRYPALPNLPAFEGMDIPAELALTLRDEEAFLLSKDTYIHPPTPQSPQLPLGRPETTLIFGCAKRFKELCGAKEVFADGTFKVCPDPFYQLYIIHIVYGSCTRPCLFILMSRKTQFAYDRLFSTLRNLAAVRGHAVEWKVFHSDFEVAVMTSILSVFAHIDISVKGCYFHLASAMFKKAVMLGLKGYYRLRPVKFHIKMCMALAFLPVAQISATLDMIVASYAAQVFAGKPDLARFFAYVRTSWVEGGVVPAENWSFYGNHGRRSTCDCEGYHSKIAKKFEKTKSLWKFLEKLQIEE